MILKKERLNDLLEALASKATVYVPRELDGQTRFAPFAKGSAVELGKAKTVFSPKETLFPQTETLYTYAQLGEDITLCETVNTTNQVLFGVRSCDTYSIERLDEVFLTRTFIDTLYLERRNNTLIVALGCTEPDRSCFCTSFGIDPAAGTGADIQLTDTGDGYFVEALTGRGTEALQAWSPFLTEGQKTAARELTFSLALDTSNVKDSLEQLFEHAYWNDLSMKCLGCGTCAFVCPTCHCFDMSQNNKGNTGYRFRTWDSCTFSDYSMMAGFHNPRPTKMRRLRNRFMHKLSFFSDRYGSSLCCGCGRCIELCPAGIDISRVIEDTSSLMGAGAEQQGSTAVKEVAS
ncbi:MAG: 4Fe-4S dicluster domain-containing protein [Coriobacteriales bacterium]|nr:4Fe-4S dicluster domain-containing protein [Coriobacteriales bacterium]